MLAAWGCSKKSSEAEGERPEASGEVSKKAAVIDAAPTAPEVERYSDVGAAIAAIARREKPRVIGIGEAHQLRTTAHILSPIARFTADAVPVLGQLGASNLVLETWAEREKCGAVQKQVDTQVRRDTERPRETQSELVRLLAALDERGIGRHGMTMSCEEYRHLLGDAGAVDYSRLLTLITGKLDALTKKVLSKAPSESVIVVYGGALHNDLYPAKGVEGWSYAASVEDVAGGRYVEIDFYVPELIAGDEVLKGQPWFELTGSEELASKVLVVRRGPRSYVVLARRGVANPETKSP